MPQTWFLIEPKADGTYKQLEHSHHPIKDVERFNAEFARQGTPYRWVNSLNENAMKAELEGLLKASYERMQTHLIRGLAAMRILSGDEVGPSGTTVSYMAGQAAMAFESLARQLRQAEKGISVPFLVFPSPDDEAPDENDS